MRIAADNILGVGVGWLPSEFAQCVVFRFVCSCMLAKIDLCEKKITPSETPSLKIVGVRAVRIAADKLFRWCAARAARQTAAGDIVNQEWQQPSNNEYKLYNECNSQEEKAGSNLVRVQLQAVPLSWSLQDFDESECAICLAIISFSSNIALPCAHRFHKDCVSLWKRRKATCPLCRNNF